MRSFFILVSLALSALAQQATIISPANGSTIAAGDEIVVNVHQDEAATDDVQIAIVLGIDPCLGGTCPAPGADGVGTILLKSLFDPQFDPNTPQEGLHQLFNVTVPQIEGLSVLSLTHLQMVGVSGMPLFD
ncbi:hypothetical protein BD309DRAFT_866692 [Dichomitus squalens]|nr:hypothetical protein BD309DRAFT_866692 [Dichomitus squalens]